MIKKRNRRIEEQREKDGAVGEEEGRLKNHRKEEI